MCTNPSHPVLAATLDIVMAGLKEARTKVLPQAEGHVLEIGVGTGLNFPLYDFDRIESLTGVEPDPHMLKRARKRAQALSQEIGCEIALSDDGAEALPMSDDSFDTVVCTFVLCTIPDVKAALQQMLRVLKPGGKLLFVEHVLAKGKLAASMQGALDPIWGHLAGGCHLNRDAVHLIEEAGFDDVTSRGLGRQNWNVFPVICGEARGGETDA